MGLDSRESDELKIVMSCDFLVSGLVKGRLELHASVGARLRTYLSRTRL